MRQHALDTFQASLRGRCGRPPPTRDHRRYQLHCQRRRIRRARRLDAHPQRCAWPPCRHALHLLWRSPLALGVQDLAWESPPSPSDLALRQVQQLPRAIRWRAKQVHLLADAGFGSATFMSGVQALGLDLTVGMRVDRLTVYGQHLKDITAQQRRVFLQGLSDLPLWLYWIWLPAKQGERQEQRFLVSSHRRTPRTAKQTGRRRWKIEALFKTLKSRFAFSKFGQKTKVGVLRYLCLSLACFLLCHFEYLDQIGSSQAESAWPDWGALARQVRMKLVGWVPLFEIERMQAQILAVWDEDQRHAA
ncbi:transposase [Deinococcus hopiensis]|uniref:transposase n=1 Tax=Deinococcus hopiensis TaxID=309885 RepID=UPI0009FE1A87|nr:transposase [Deinococcus hopiensis]